MKLTKQITGRADKHTRGDVLLYPEGGSGTVYTTPDGQVTETLDGEPPVATSQGWGDMSWQRSSF